MSMIVKMLGASLRTAMIGVLISLTACGHTARLQFHVRAEPERVMPAALPRPPSEARATLGQARRVLVDVSSGCRRLGEDERARCLRFEAMTADAITRTGRQVVLASHFEMSSLDLARQLGIPLLLIPALPAPKWSKSQVSRAVQPVAPELNGPAPAEKVCSAELRRSLGQLRAHARQHLPARWVDARDSKVLWKYSDAVDGEARTTSATLEAEYVRGEPAGGGATASSSSDGDVEVHHYHHHDSHCGHHRGADHERDDDGKAFAALILTLLVVGIIVIAVSNQAQMQEWCTVSEPAPPSLTDKAALAEHFDRLLSQRLADALGPLAVSVPDRS